MQSTEKILAPVEAATVSRRARLRRGAADGTWWEADTRARRWGALMGVTIPGVELG